MSTTAQRDVDRRQVYRAEELAAELTILDERRSLAELVAIAERLRSGWWWQAHFGTRGIEVRTNRSRLGSYWNPTTRIVSLCPSASDLSTLCHELAHVAATDWGRSTGPPHGPMFRTLHVGVRHALLGQRAGDDLAEVYTQFGLPLHRFSSAIHDRPAWAETALDPAEYTAERIVRVDRFDQRPSGSIRPGPIAL